MAVSYTNNWLNILNKLQNILRTEFKNALPVYIGHKEDRSGNQYLRLEPNSSDLVEYSKTFEKREFSVNMFYYAFKKNIEKVQLEGVLTIVSRIEALVHDNVNISLADSTVAYNCRIESTELDVLDDEEKYVVQLSWQCLHLGNLS